MTNKELEDAYYMHKFILAIIYDNEYDYYKKISWTYELEVLEEFRDIVKELVNYGCINKRTKDNIYKILIDGRQVKDKDYESRINLINETIIIMNSQDNDNYLRYYLGELVLRRDSMKIFKNWTLNDLENEIPYVDKSIFNDFYVLFTHDDQVSDEEFINDYLPDFVNDNLYYESLNVILHECPSMFKNELFAKRVNMILSLNKEIDKTFKKSHNKIKRKVRKYNN